MKNLLPVIAAITFLPVLPANAAELVVNLEVPRIDTAEYHRPYVAVWIENDRREQVLQLALWLEQEKWHRDLRSWWRRGGKSLDLPVDGASGATRRPGSYLVRSTGALQPGSYTLNIEAVREVGGREHLRIPFQWGEGNVSGALSGESELGAVSYRIEEEK